MIGGCFFFAEDKIDSVKEIITEAIKKSSSVLSCYNLAHHSWNYFEYKFKQLRVYQSII